MWRAANSSYSTRENIRAVLNRADGASERYTERYEHGR